MSSTTAVTLLRAALSTNVVAAEGQAQADAENYPDSQRRLQSGQSDTLLMIIGTFLIAVVVALLGVLLIRSRREPPGTSGQQRPCSDSTQSRSPSPWRYGKSVTADIGPVPFPAPAPAAPSRPAQPVAPPAACAARRAFDAMDRDHSGFISRQELRPYLGDMPPGTAEAAFNSLDANGDNRISFEEFRRFFHPVALPTDPPPPEPDHARRHSHAYPQIDSGRWWMEWPGGHEISLLEDEQFEAAGHRFVLQLDPSPPRFEWQDGTLQELKNATPNVVTWSVKPRTSGEPDQTLRWIRVPSCPEGSDTAGHLMEPSDKALVAVCRSCVQKKSCSWAWRCRSCASFLCPECAPLPPEPEPVLGICAYFLLNIFPELARVKTGNQNPNFYDMSTVLAAGTTGLGYRKTCPRDGKVGCSIVDAVDPRHRGRVTHFVSWCWAYTLDDFVSAIGTWARQQSLETKEVFLWVCFFCNNQYRILESDTKTGSENLKTVFESHLAKAGRMLILLDSFEQPTYITRAWCIFETYVCIDNNFPMTIILPERAEDMFRQKMETSGGLTALRQEFDAMDVRSAVSSSPEDQEMIRDLILMTTGYDAVNRAVKSCLEDQLKELWHTCFRRK